MTFLCESRSPLCDLMAAVGKDENAYYLYLMESPDLKPKIVRILWLCNRRPAPEELKIDHGISPLMPRAYVAHDPAGMELDEDAFEIVWYACGDSAALFYHGSLLAVIPPYAGVFEFPGFTRYIRERHRYGWPLDQDDCSNVLGWLKQANKQWEFIFSEDGWKQLDDMYREAYALFVGEPQHYLHLDRETLPHRRLWMGQQKGVCYDLTVGMAQAEMPRVQCAFGKEYKEYARIELGFACEQAYAKLAEQLVPVMDDLMQMPWQERNFFAHGHTIDYPAIGGCKTLLLLRAAQVPGMAAPPLPDIMGCPVRLHWIVPITEKELAFLREKGIEALLRRSFMPELVHIYDGHPRFLA